MSLQKWYLLVTSVYSYPLCSDNLVVHKGINTISTPTLGNKVIFILREIACGIFPSPTRFARNTTRRRIHFSFVSRCKISHLFLCFELIFKYLSMISKMLERGLYGNENSISNPRHDWPMTQKFYSQTEFKHGSWMNMVTRPNKLTLTTQQNR